MKNNWKSIWDGKKVERIIDDNLSEFEAFCILKKADGFDVAVQNEERYYTAFYREFDTFYSIAKKLCNGEIGSVYEVGCGSGVNLYMFLKRMPMIRLGGLDYSENLLAAAKTVTGGEDFENAEAVLLPETPEYDIVMSEGVFEYFESIEYAKDVLAKMIHKSKKLTCVMSVYDMEREAEMMKHRRSLIPDYDTRYENLGKCFYEKAWFMEIAEKAGKNVLFTKCDNEEYWNAKYQYNVFII